MVKHFYIMLLTALLLIAGCATYEQVDDNIRYVDLPTWYTRPTPEMSNQSAVSLLMRTPEHLDIFRRKYELPGWLVYGVVRSLGTKEFIVTATHKTFTETEADLSNVTLIDNIQYDVQINGIEKALQKIARKCALAESGQRRREVLVSHLTRRTGAYVLFSLTPQVESGMDIITSNNGDDTAMERFSSGSTETKTSTKPDERLGWSESDSRFSNTFAAEIIKDDVFESFRIAEEKAIYDMARNIVRIYSRGTNTSSVSGIESNDTPPSHNISLTVKGLRIDRRKVDLDSNTCIVTISAPIDGISINKISPIKE